jgi:hypothetical protein
MNGVRQQATAEAALKWLPPIFAAFKSPNQ